MARGQINTAATRGLVHSNTAAAVTAVARRQRTTY